MKILHVIPTLKKGGAERMVVSICNQLQKEGHEVRILLLYNENQYLDFTHHLTILHTPTQLQLSLWKKNQVDVSTLQQAIDAFHPDVVHSHLFEAEINLAFCQFPVKCKRVVHFHDNMVQMAKPGISTICSKRSITNGYERKIILEHLPIDTHLIGISNHTVAYIKENIDDSFTINCLQNGVDLSVFNLEPEVVRQPTLVTVGTLNELKGHELALRAVKSLAREGVDAHLYLLGDGPERTNLVSLAENLNIAHLIHFEGKVDHPEAYLNRSSVYVHTSRSEAFGLVLIEAMACGLPVVTTDGGGNRDLIEQGQNGYLIKDRSATELADKIHYLLENKAVRQRMSTYAYAYAQQFGMDIYIQKLLSIYRSNN